MVLGEDFDLEGLTAAIIPNETAYNRPHAAGARYVGCLRAPGNKHLRISHDWPDVPNVQREKILSVIGTNHFRSIDEAYGALQCTARACEVIEPPNL